MELVLRVTFEPGVVYTVDLGVVFEHLGDGHRVFDGLFDAHYQGFATPEGQPTVKRVKTCAHCFQSEIELVVQILIVKADAACHKVRVAPYILSERDAYNIGAKVQWVLAYGGHESIVHNEKGAMTLTNF